MFFSYEHIINLTGHNNRQNDTGQGKICHLTQKFSLQEKNLIRHVNLN